jgi:TatD family-associated radical SAM protein
MTITYQVGNGLYVNITNRCGNRCDFCLREFTDTVGDAHSLWLEREPTREEIWDAIRASNLNAYTELVFCGYGEPTERLPALLWVCSQIRAFAPQISVRINTNGQANLIDGSDVTPRLQGLVDALSISLNYPDAESYERHCRPAYPGTFEGMLSFTRLATAYVPTVTMTVLDLLPAVDIEECRRLAAACGAGFRVRKTVESI